MIATTIPLAPLRIMDADTFVELAQVFVATSDLRQRFFNLVESIPAFTRFDALRSRMVDIARDDQGLLHSMPQANQGAITAKNDRNNHAVDFVLRKAGFDINKNTASMSNTNSDKKDSKNQITSKFSSSTEIILRPAQSKQLFMRHLPQQSRVILTRPTLKYSLLSFQFAFLCRHLLSHVEAEQSLNRGRKVTSSTHRTTKVLDLSTRSSINSLILTYFQDMYNKHHVQPRACDYISLIHPDHRLDMAQNIKLYVSCAYLLFLIMATCCCL